MPDWIKTTVEIQVSTVEKYEGAKSDVEASEGFAITLDDADNLHLIAERTEDV